MDATVSAPLARPDLSSSMSRANNQDWVFITQNYMLNKAPDYYVYLYNVSTMEHKISRPPMLREVTMPARRENEKYILVTRLPVPLLVPKGNVDSSEIDFIPTDTRRFAMDLINPDNLGLNQDAVIAPKEVTSQGNNLGKKGVFWSLSNPPKEEEVTAAYRRMEAHYKQILNEARTVETSNPKELPNILGPEHHVAAEYFHETTNWHNKPVHKENCPRCGMPATVGAPFHMIEGGGFCVGDWDKAIRTGVRSRAQAYEATGDEKYAPKQPKPQAPAPQAPEAQE